MLRLYAAFNTHILCNNDKAGVLTAEADRIEDQKAKEHNTEGSKALHFFTESQLDLSSDSTAMITMDASPSNLGTILSANAAACKLFGFSRLQLERRSAFTLMPTLLAEWHENAIRSYLSTGEGSIVDYTRIIFGTHKSGSLLPILSNVRDAPADEGAATLVWMLRDLRTTYQYVLLDVNSFVLGLSAGSAVMLGMDVRSDVGTNVNIHTFIREWDQPSVQAELLSSSGALVKVDAHTLAGDTDSDGSDDNNEAAGTSNVMQSMWVRAMLQKEDVEGTQMSVLHWKRPSLAEAPLVAQAERKRARLLHIELPSHQETENYVSMYEIPTVQDPIGSNATDSSHTIPHEPQEDEATGVALQDTPRYPVMEHVEVKVEVSEAAHERQVDLQTALPGRVNMEDDDSSDERPTVAVTIPPVLKAALRVRAASQASTEIPSPDTTGFVFGARSPPGKVSRGATKELSSHYEDGSVTSKSSSASRSVSKLRRYLSSGQHSLLRGLWWLRALGFGLLLLAIGLAIAVSVNAESNFALMSNNLHYIVSGSNRMLYKANAVYNLQDLIFEARGWITLTSNETALRREYMETNVSMFSAEHRRMYEIVSADTTSSNSYTDRYIGMTDFGATSASPFGTVVVRNLVEVGSYFSSVMYRLATAQSDFSRLNDDALNTILIHYMRLGNGHETLLTSMELGFALSLQLRTSIHNNQTAIFVAMVLVILFIALGIFVPILRNIDKDSEAIMMQFVLLPLPIRSDLFDQASKRASLLRREFGDDVDASDDETDEEGQNDEEAQAYGQDAPARLAQSGATDDAITFYPSSSGATPILPAATHKLRKGAPTHKKNPWGFVSLSIRFLFPMCLLLIFFIVFYIQFEKTLESVFTLTAISAAANRRAQCARQATCELRKLQYLTTDWRYIRNVFWSTMQAADCVRNHNRLIAFGDTTGISGLYVSYVPPIQEWEDHGISAAVRDVGHRVSFGNVCDVLTAAGSNIDHLACEAFSGGIMREGSLAVTEEWYNTMYAMSERMLRAGFFIGNLSSGNGYEVPTSLFNYSQYECMASEGCNLRRDYTKPANGAALGESLMPDKSYVGDYNASLSYPDYTPYSTANAMKDPRLRDLYASDQLYMTPAFMMLATVYTDEAQSLISDFQTFKNVFVPAFMVMICLVIVVVYVPQIDSVNRDIQGKRAMLLYLPVEVINKNRSIKLMIQDFLSKVEAGGKPVERIRSP